MVRISDYKKRKYLATGFPCSAKGRDCQKNIPKRNHPPRKYLEAVIGKKKSDYQLQLLSLEREQQQSALQQVIKAIKKPT
jgi:hypothetical protein